MTQARQLNMLTRTTNLFYCTNVLSTDALRENRTLSLHPLQQCILDIVGNTISAFSVEVIRISIQRNYFDIIAMIDNSTLHKLTDLQIAQKWSTLFKPDSLIKRFINGMIIHETEKPGLSARITSIRERMANLSSFMGKVSEQITRRSRNILNIESKLWKGRYNSKPVLDKVSLYCLLAHLDLVEQDLFNTNTSTLGSRFSRNYGFCNESSQSSVFDFKEYRELLQWMQHYNSDTYISPITPSFLTIHQLDAREWINYVTRFKPESHSIFGLSRNKRQFCKSVGKRWVWGMGN